MQMAANTSSMTTYSLQFHTTNGIDDMIAFVTEQVSTLLECSKHRTHYYHRLLPSVESFVRQVYIKCRVPPTVLVVALIYLRRLKQGIPDQSRGEYDTPYKLFLAAIVLASKFTEDSKTLSRTIYHFVAALYTPQELHSMERSFLGIVKYDLYVDMNQMIQYLEEQKDTLGLEAIH